MSDCLSVWLWRCLACCLPASLLRFTGHHVLGQIKIHVWMQKRMFLVDGPGKSFVYNLLLAYVRVQDSIALASASCGLAALVLKGGQTAHSRFKINIPVTSHCE